jgi:dienelactone hydrolase
VSARPEKKGYRVVAVSLYTPEADWIEETTQALKRAGNQKANRSLVVREAILRLQESLQNKSPDELLADFTEREAKRANRNL